MYIEILAKPNQNNPLPVLGDKVLAINNLWITRGHIFNIRNPVAQLIQGLSDHLKSFALVVAF